MSVEPNELIERAVGGDREALHTLLRDCGNAIRHRQARLIPGKLCSLLSADDVMQQTFADVSRAIQTLRGRTVPEFQVWVRRIADRNRKDTVKYLLRERRWPHEHGFAVPGSEQSYHQLFKGIPGAISTASKVAVRNEAESHLRSAIATLPDNYARAVELVLAGHKVPEIANEMGKSEGAIFMLLQRAYMRLREVLGRTSKYFDSRA